MPYLPMSATVQVRPQVLAAKKRLAEARALLRQQHDQGSPGIQVCARLTDMLDTIVLDVYEAAIRDLAAEGGRDWLSEIALVPHGGYGRRDVAPYSDVDLMLLHAPSVGSCVRELAKRLVIDLSDAGLDLGFSVRTPGQACSLGRSDPVIFTSLVEARYLVGSNKLFAQFDSRFRRTIRQRVARLIDTVRESRREERLQYGKTVFLLEPNVKRSPGGLRDLQLLRWIGFARFGEADANNLRRMQRLSSHDQSHLRSATDFLLRLRNDLHFHAGRSYDVLDKSEQIRLAEKYGYDGKEGVLLPVEQFMQEYFRHTSEVRSVVSHFANHARPRSWLTSIVAPLFSHRSESDYRVGPIHIRATRKGQERLRGDLAEVLRLLDLANLYDKWIDADTWNTIRTAMEDMQRVEITPATVQRFLSILSQPSRLGDTLRKLHQLRVLEKIIPGMNHARCLLQFNEYHKYTVDEHCIRSVECATEFLRDSGPLGDAYRSIKRKRTLHLALLLHDLGKGFSDDHSDVGAQLACTTAKSLQLGQRESEKLVLLVHRHLAMSHLAFQRDTSDESLVVQFAVEVGTPDALKMLFVLTCADLAAVGPGTLNDWKVEVLTDLYLRTMKHLAGDAPSIGLDQWLARKREAVRASKQGRDSTDWLDRQIESLPISYLRWTSTEQIMEELTRLEKLPNDTVEVWARYLPDHKAIQYTVAAFDQLTPGIFHKLTGALTSRGLQILAADIYTLSGGLVLDRFYVQDPDYPGEPPECRLEEIRSQLVNALMQPDATPSFRQTWHTNTTYTSQTQNLAILPTRVNIDNSTSDHYTIVDVFAHDRMGLLYTITRTLFELGLSVAVAKIETFSDQVVDVFYVTDEGNAKVHDEARILRIKSCLLRAIENMSVVCGS